LAPSWLSIRMTRRSYCGADAGKASVTGKIVQQGRAKKVTVLKFKKTNQYKIQRGHRQNYTAVQVSGYSKLENNCSTSAPGFNPADSSRKGLRHGSKNRRRSPLQTAAIHTGRGWASSAFGGQFVNAGTILVAPAQVPKHQAGENVVRVLGGKDDTSSR